MPEDYDYQRLMTACAGAFFGVILGTIIGVLIIISLDLLKVNAGNLAKLAIMLACILAGAALLTIHEVRKHEKQFT
ncbi:MAG TPA: hypothetical protein VMC84_00590 [Methanocella sp.]|uniref:hypothetical protein n=1 Tax=Methanocella sp. TaxID=2052833 RepID=UPI002CB3AC58|nr:hypothetical protein [Methanocella sp.]HTY89651.1 hypothetical protein [Methanocella sp.]